MNTYAIPMYLYVQCRSPEEAMQRKQQIEQLLSNPLVKPIIDSNVPNVGFVVQNPQIPQPR